ncbi:hypothetical protein KAT51_06690, partial [bacterium]|nr:hypothetical protein [bacterium]
WRKQATGYRLQASEVKIDGRFIPCPQANLDLGKAVKWEWMGSIELEKGEHRVTAEKAPQEIIIVPEEKIIQARGKVLNYLKGTKTLPTYFFSKKLSSDVDSWERRLLRTSFYLPSSGNYSLRAKVSPRYVEALDYGLKEEAGKYGKKWSFVPKNVKYFTSTRKDILTVNTYFNGDAKEREFLKLERDVKPVDIERYPDFEINYSLTHPDIQRVEVILGIDLNNDGKVNARISEELPSGSEKEFNTYDFNLYKKVGDSLGRDLPSDASFRLVKLYFKISKKDKLDCSTSPNKGWHKTSFKNFGLCGFSEDKYVKSRDYAFNERIGLHKELKKGKSKVIFSRFFEGLNLEKYPYINLIHQNENPKNLLVNVILYLDFNGDGKVDEKIIQEGITPTNSFFDALELVKSEFPDKKYYYLAKLIIKICKNPEIATTKAQKKTERRKEKQEYESVFLQHLQIYNEEITPYKKVLRAMPILEIDQRKLSLTKFGSWYTTSPVYLKEGYHNLEALFPGLETKLDFIIVEPRAESREKRADGKVRKWESEKVGSGASEQLSKQGPEIIFQKINPTKYKVKIKGAKKPFWLVFSENFHAGWRAYVKKSKIKNQISKIKKRNFEEIVAEYPGLGVKEARPLQKFTPGDVKYLFRKADIEEHYLGNSYANAWYIDPSKVHPPNWQRQLGGPKSKVKEMEIVLYFWPQSLFYVGLFISGFTLIGYLSYLFCNRRKRKNPVAFLKKASCRRKS